jgi:hypothetical protein
LGVIAPFGVIYSFNTIMFIIIVVAVLRQKNKNANHKVSKLKRIIRNATITFVLAIMFGVGWIFGILGSDFGQGRVVSLLFQFLFIIFVGFQGFLIFVLYPVRSKKARDEWRKAFYYVTCRQKQYKAAVRSRHSKGQNNEPSSGPSGGNPTSSTAVSSTGGTIGHRPRAHDVSRGSDIGRRFGLRPRSESTDVSKRPATGLPSTPTALEIIDELSLGNSSVALSLPESALMLLQVSWDAKKILWVYIITFDIARNFETSS